MAVKRFSGRGFVPEDYEYEIRRPDEQQYAGISLEELKALCMAEDSDIDGIGRVRYRPRDGQDKFVLVDPRDMGEFADAILGRPFDAVDCCAPAPVITNGGGTVMRFCCHAMMNGLLGGTGAITIDMGTAAIQVGGLNIGFCPYCGRPVSTTPPSDGE